jgi:putative acetyltransferase
MPAMSATERTIVRDETATDNAAVYLVDREAFGGADEADLVDRLRSEGVVLRSFVADSEKHIVGHILFSRVWIDTDAEPVAAAALAPVAVLPSRQRTGIGSQLIRYGLHRLQEDGERVVLVLGEPEFYERFGFSSETARDLASPFPPEAYMALELRTGELAGVHARVRYPDAFGI